MKEKEKPDRSDEEDFEGSTGMVYNGPFFPRMKDTSKKSDNQLFFEGRLKGLLNQVILAENSLPKKETKASATQKKLDLARADLKSARADLTSLEGQLEVVESNFDDVMSILRDIDSTGSNTIDEELLERVKEMVADFPEEEVGGEGGVYGLCISAVLKEFGALVRSIIGYLAISLTVMIDFTVSGLRPSLLTFSAHVVILVASHLYDISR